ncbi:MAG TPA: hypothetical protein VFL13_09720 [Candidatus Baltobacteraceae bacterium]|nr:hypothetical protein [Candidatus Baltobacteraceae bacterium]
MVDFFFAAALSAQTASTTWFGVSLGETTAYVRAALGDPIDDRAIGEGLIKSRYLVDGNKAILGVDRKDGVVVMISLTTASNEKSDAADPFGIKLGTAESAVQTKRGTPDALDNGDGADRFLYGSAPTWRYIFHDGALSTIIVNESFPPAPVHDPPLHTGTSISDAVIIKNETAVTGVEWEYAYLSFHPCSKTVPRTFTKQRLITRENREYDALETTCAGKPSQTLYFDITDYFGKL